MIYLFSSILIALLAVGILLMFKKKPHIDELKNSLIQQNERLRVIQETQNHIQQQIAEQLMRSFDGLRGQLLDALTQGNQQTNERLKEMALQTDQRLESISGQVEKRLTEGFERTTATFQDILKRLVLIDEAQKQMALLSESVISLEEVLADKRSRGAFGEVQLSHLMSNMLPQDHYALQYTFSSNARVDCILFLPAPTGNLAIDSKFPLNNYQRMMDASLPDLDRQTALKLFKQDIKKHIQDIKNKYIIPGETSDGAIMFIPAEAIFAEIHAHHPELVTLAHQSRVWLSSPTTLMAILTTVRAVIKDQATRNQVHVIQEHLIALAKDFNLFQDRMEKLATHIGQANKDVEEINTSARKLTSRFIKIEKADLNKEENAFSLLTTEL
jgi:DNA recombination protein RmuC